MAAPRLVVLSVVLAACGSRAAEVAPARLPAPAAMVADDTSPVGKLDDRAVPIAYELALAVDPGAADYTGEVTIDVDVRRPLRVLWLHGKDLTIDRATVTAGGKTQTARVVRDERTEHTEGQGELLGIAVDAPIAGSARVQLAYRARYREKDGLIRARTDAKLVYSDLEPNDARALMPCFDDPRFKVPWTVTITAPDKMGVYSNYPEQARSKVEGDRVRVVFQRTRPLPTYLVAVAVGELEVVPVVNQGVPIQLLVPGTQSVPFTKVIQDATAPLLAELVRVLDEPVAFPKLDMLVIPMDRGRGGMENPGLTTLGAHMVLVDPAITGTRARRQIEDAVHVVAHELAHLWIGDLITIGDWGELWLQEGGATWFGIRAARTYLGATWIPPFNRDVIDQRLKAGARPPIRMPIVKLEDANTMFRTETYAGGAAVFDALEAWLGEAAITGAFADLIDRRRDATMTTGDFLASVRGRSKVSADDLADSVAAILDATRMPLVAASCKPGAIELTSDTPSAVPVCLERDGAPRACTVVRGGRAIVETPTCPAWMALNPGGGAPYARAWASGTLAPVLERASIAGRDEAAMLSELRTLLITGRFGTLSVGDQVTAAAWLASAAHAAPMVTWRAVEHLEQLERSAFDTQTRRAVLARVQAITAKRAPRFSLDQDQPEVTSPLATWLARRGDKAAQAAATKAVADLVKASTAGVAGADALYARAAGSDARTFRALRARVLAEPRRTPSALRTLASFQFAGVVGELSTFVKDPKLTARDAEIVLVEAVRNPTLQAHLAKLALARADISVAVRAQLGRALCDDAEVKTIADTMMGDAAKNERTRMLDTVARCLATRAAWDVK